MNECNPNSSAFPSMENFEKFNDDTGIYVDNYLPVGGLTKREYFAGLAMQGYISAGSQGMPGPVQISNLAVTTADFLMKELEKKNEQ